MKDIFNRRQRFSLRKYSVGVCSVLLGTALFAAGTQTVLADEVENPADSSSDVILVKRHRTKRLLFQNRSQGNRLHQLRTMLQQLCNLL